MEVQMASLSACIEHTANYVHINSYVPKYIICIHAIFRKCVDVSLLTLGYYAISRTTFVPRYGNILCQSVSVTSEILVKIIAFK